VEPSQSNPFARAVRETRPPGPAARRVRVALGLVLTLLLVVCGVLAVVLLGALVVRGLRHRDWIALLAAVAVIAMTLAMARRRRR
jgi:hypothetical protein